jgi:hypothetical protein
MMQKPVCRFGVVAPPGQSPETLAHDDAGDFLSDALAAAQRERDSANARIISAQHRFNRVAVEFSRQGQGVRDRIEIDVARGEQFARAIAKMEGVALCRQLS